MFTNSYNHFTHFGFLGLWGCCIFEINPNNTNKENEERFAKMLAQENMGLSLLKATNNELTEWEKVEYNTNTGKAETIPCQ